MHTAFKGLMRAAVVSLPIAAPALGVADDEPALRLTTGVDFSRGDYGHRKDTEILCIPVSPRYESFPWTVALTVPYVRISGPGGVIGAGEGGAIVVPDTPGGGGQPGSGNGNGAGRGGGFSSEKGLGDVIAAATYALDANSEGLSKRGLAVDIFGRVKFATADSEWAIRPTRTSRMAGLAPWGWITGCVKAAIWA